MPKASAKKCGASSTMPREARIGKAPRIDRRDRGAVAVAEQDAAAKADGVEHARQHLARLLVHEGDAARHRRGARAPVAGAGVDEHAEAGRLRDPVGKIAPQPDRAEPFVKEHDGRRRIGRRPDHAVFETGLPDFEKALSVQFHCCQVSIRLRLAGRKVGRGRACPGHPDHMARPCPAYRGRRDKPGDDQRGC